MSEYGKKLTRGEVMAKLEELVQMALNAVELDTKDGQVRTFDIVKGVSVSMPLTEDGLAFTLAYIRNNVDFDDVETVISQYRPQLEQALLNAKKDINGKTHKNTVENPVDGQEVSSGREDTIDLNQ